ncbi:MAG: HNH endonuclease [Clostridia bacterium]|nr:HNH endonuclease [Clostridia bacterium]
MEQWKVVKGFENYLVSSLGNVKTINGKLKKVVYDSKNDYGYVELWKNNKGKKFRIHRLVAETFIPNTLGKEQVNHIDGDKKNNCVSNLEWVTPKENIRHAIENDLSSIKYGSKNLASKLKEEDVKYIRENAKINKSVRELSEIYNISTTTIYNIINYKKWLKM